MATGKFCRCLILQQKSANLNKILEFSYSQTQKYPYCKRKRLPLEQKV
jgi:hypothetical protein